MNDRVEFKSLAFPKYDNEDEELVNSHLWGKRLAEFVRDNLPKHGVETAGILCEDFGWLVEVKHDAAFPLWIGCGVMDEFDEEDESDEDDGPSSPPVSKSGGDQASGPTEFAIFVAAEPGFFAKLFKKVDPEPAVARVSAALEKMIAASPEFQDVQWIE